MVAVMGRRPRQARQFTLLTGHTLQSVRLGDVVALEFSGGGRVLIETVVRLTEPGGRVEHGPDALATLLGDVVRNAAADDAGTLTITFGSGACLLVDAHAETESWAVADPGGQLIVCL